MDEFLALAWARERSLPVVVARVFKPSARARLAVRHGGAALHRRRPERPALKVYGDGFQTRCFCLVTDTVEALMRLQGAPAARGGVFNVGGTEEVSIKHLAELVIGVLGSRQQIEVRALRAGLRARLRGHAAAQASGGQAGAGY